MDMIKILLEEANEDYENQGVFYPGGIPTLYYAESRGYKVIRQDDEHAEINGVPFIRIYHGGENSGDFWWIPA